MLGLIISIIVVGLIAGAVARLVVPGHQNLMSPERQRSRGMDA